MLLEAVGFLPELTQEGSPCICRESSVIVYPCLSSGALCPGHAEGSLGMLSRAGGLLPWETVLRGPFYRVCLCLS
jgi:hypothetical protein